MNPELEKIIDDTFADNRERPLHRDDAKRLADAAYALGQQNPGPTRYVLVRVLLYPHGDDNVAYKFWGELDRLFPVLRTASDASRDSHITPTESDWNLIQQIPGWETQLREVK